MKPTILLVEDNKELLEVVAEELSDNYEVYTAENGKEALQSLEKNTIQLLISDVTMPIMDGFELCKNIKSNVDYSHIPVILLTARTSLQSKVQGLGMGADAYIEKPFETEFLKAQIESLLANRKKIRDYFANSPLVHIKTIAHNSTEETFLDKLTQAIHANIDDQSLDVDRLARLMNMGRTSLFRKIKSLTDFTPNELINITRLKKAADLLTDGNFRIYEVSDMVGYASQTNFGRNFLRQFGMTPKDFQKKHTEKAN